MSNFSMGMAAAAVISMAGTAFGGYTFTQSAAPAPTYASTLNFDEPGAPTGAVANNAFAAWGIPDLQAGDGAPYVSDETGNPGLGWLGTGNSFKGHFGVFLTFGSDVDSFSTQFWDPSGPPSPFGGGAVAYLFNDGAQVGEAFGYSFEPAWGGVGDEWLNITTDGGSVFDEIRILGNGFFPESHIDNLSWNPVPAPGSAIALGALGLAGLRRRRA